jgi:2-dehydropantoate 2-reductase
MTRKILIVGGGAVGQVYGWALERAGAEISYYLKPQHAEAAQSGFKLHWLNRDREQRSPLTLQRFKVFTDVATVSVEKWDSIYLTVSSAALRTGWLESFAPAVARTPGIVMLQPGIHDRDYLRGYFKTSQLLCEVITFIAFPTSNGAATAFYTPPFHKTPLGAPLGEKQMRQTAFYTATLHAFISALEQADWSLEKLRQPQKARQLHHAISQTLAGVVQQTRMRPPLLLRLLSPLLLRAAIRMAPALFPFDFETYLKNHFTKVSAQTRLMNNDYVELCVRHGLPHDAILNQKVGTTFTEGR